MTIDDMILVAVLAGRVGVAIGALGMLMIWASRG
jgi:hypothetical protein